MPDYNLGIFQPSFSYGDDTGKVKGSDTSVEHANYEKRRASGVQGVIFACIVASEFTGMTSKEVEEETDLPHQTVSSTLRNLELDGYVPDEWPKSYGRIVKLKEKRNNQHAYVTSYAAKHTNTRFLAQPTPRRTSWKGKYMELIHELNDLAADMRGEAPEDGWVGNRDDFYWHHKLMRILRERR